MSDLINIGASGLRAYQTALSAVSENIVNANTAGYSRRSVTLNESAVSNGNSLLYRAQVNFGGVQVGDVQRASDAFKTADARLAESDGGRSDAKLAWLSQVETNLDDSALGVGKQVTAVFNAGDALAANPGDAQLRSQFLSAVDGAASAFRTTATNLAHTATSVSTQAQTTVDQINANLTALAKVNIELRRAGAGTSAHAQMEDQRDQLLTNLSGQIGIDVALDNDGVATVSLTGTNNVTLVQNDKANYIGMTQAADGRIGLEAQAATGRVTFTANGGAIAGLADVAGQLADRRASLDQIATDFATQMNTWSAAGVDQAGNAGGYLLDATGGAAGIKSTVTDPTLVAAASTDGTENGNLLTLPALRGANGIEARWAALVTSNAQTVQAAKSENSVTSSRRDSANSAADAVSGVNLDSEAADLMRFQQAYSASAQVIKVARDTMNTILQIF